MGKSILGEDMFPDMVRIYQNKNSSDKYQTTPYWEMIYEGRANIQEKDTGSETNDVDKSEYAAYLEDNDVTIPPGVCWIGRISTIRFRTTAIVGVR